MARNPGGLLSLPYTLPCKTVLPNRLAKAAMTECLADARTNLPNEHHIRLYQRWAKGGLGMCLTGNVQVDRRYLEAPRNVCLEEADAKNLYIYKRWAAACKQNGCVAIVQVSHPGRQCSIACTSKPVAPSAVQVKAPGLPALISPMRTPRALTEGEIKEVIARFVATCRLCEEAGFDGVQLHAAHGYLLSQFLSPRANLRTDQWGGSPENRRRLLLTIVKELREVVKPGFVVAVKLNSADFQHGGFTEEESMAVIAELQKLRVDFVEISGGTYENTVFMGQNKKSESTARREAFFLEFAEKVRRTYPEMPLMLTGGFRSRQGMLRALESGAVDLIGLARPLCVQPELPRQLVAGSSEGFDDYHTVIDGHLAPLARWAPAMYKSVGSGAAVFWHEEQIHRMARGQEPDRQLSTWRVFPRLFFRTWVWEPRRTRNLHAKLFLVLVAFVALFWLLFLR